MLLKPDQTFVWADDLRADLDRLIDEWNSLDESAKEERYVQDGKYPPQIEGSIVSTLWKLHMPPRTRPAGNLLPTLPKEFVDQIRELLNKLSKEIDKNEGR